MVFSNQPPQELRLIFDNIILSSGADKWLFYCLRLHTSFSQPLNVHVTFERKTIFGYRYDGCPIYGGHAFISVAIAGNLATKSKCVIDLIFGGKAQA